MATIARGGAISLVGAGVSAVSGFGLVLAVTNGFSAHVAGAFFALTSIFLLLSSISSLGVDVGLGRFMLRFVAQERSGDLPLLLRAAFRPVLWTTLAVCLSALLLSGPIADLTGLDDQGRTALRLLVLILPAAVITDCALAGTRAFGRMRATVLVDRIGRSAAQPILAVIVALLGWQLSGLVLGWALPYVVSAVAAGWFLRRLVRRRVNPAHTTADYPTVRREFWSFTWARGVTALSQMAIQRADIVLIAALRSPAEAAVYTAATRFVVIGQLGAQAIQQVLQPRFTALLADAQTGHTALGSVYRISTAWTMAVSWPLYLAIGCAPALYLSLFGPEYRDTGVAVVVVMMAAMLFAVAAGPADTLLLMHGRSGLSLGNGLTALGVDIALCFVLIPRMGIAGAAVAWAAAVTVRCALSLIQLRALLRIVSCSRGSAVVAAAAVVCFAGPSLLLGGLGLLSPLTWAGGVLLGAAAYLYALWLARDTLLLSSLRALVRRPSSQPPPRRQS